MDAATAASGWKAADSGGGWSLADSVCARKTGSVQQTGLVQFLPSSPGPRASNVLEAKLEDLVFYLLRFSACTHLLSLGAHTY